MGGGGFVGDIEHEVAWGDLGGSSLELRMVLVWSIVVEGRSFVALSLD